MENAVILCVDDERVVLNGLQSQLSRDFGNEYILEFAESGEEALELIEEFLQDGVDIPVVISDQLMPGLKGHQLLTKVHHLSPKSFKILLTGQSDLEAVTDAVNQANLYRYIGKPWEGTDLILTVREAIKSFYQDKQLEVQNRLLERHNRELEALVEERTVELRQEKEKSEELLLNILPNETAEELIKSGVSSPKHYDMVSVLFTDFKAFTKAASEISPQELVETLNECFTAFDEICDKHQLEKIKTIGDAYMCAGGLPVANNTNPIDAVTAACEISRWTDEWNQKRQTEGKTPWEIRIGVHTGELVAGVIGKRKFAYDVWGDAVNIAARIESSGEEGKVNISGTTYELVKDRFSCTHRGKIDVRGKGQIEMYFVVS